MVKTIVVAALAAVLLSGCAGAGFKSAYNKPDGRTLLVSKDDWQDFQEYLGNIGSTRSGAFVVAVFQDKTEGWTSSHCPVDNCYGNNSENNAMRSCRDYGLECVLFASNSNILVNYEVEE